MKQIAKRKTGSAKQTPLMRQYNEVKAKHPDALLLFRVGDFYETFGEDAVKASGVLGIVLTSRNNGGSDIELAGFPHHSLDMYLPRLVRAGFRVAICEQLEKPSREKKVVRRGITELVTPGITVDDKLLDHDRNNFLASVHFLSRDHFGIAMLDVSTGEFLVSEGDGESIDKLLQSMRPSEVLVSKSQARAFGARFGSEFYTYYLDEWLYTREFGRDKLLDQFNVASLKGFSIEDLEAAQIAAGAILQYLADTQHAQLGHINAIQRIHPSQYLWMDRFTIRNLELIEPAFHTGKALVDVLDNTTSPMGARLLRKWIIMPLLEAEEIRKRYAVVKFLVENTMSRDELTELVRTVGDLERLSSKIAMGKINPRELKQVERALRAVSPMKDMLSDRGGTALAEMADAIDTCDALAEQIAQQLVEEPPVNLSKGNVIRENAHEELDDLRHTIRNAKELLVQIQTTEAERTGIHSLKIGFNNVFGYYLEVTNKYKDKGLVPDNWIRKQTLTNSERYISEELKKLEEKILGAEERILELEQQLYDGLVSRAGAFIPRMQGTASVVARLDCLITFASNALRYGYVMPEIHENASIDIRDGRHPVIERQLELGEDYVPNSIALDTEEQQILLITGPNMSGKSAVLRQTALICIMAQIGSFVPAKSASLGILDRLFTRVGASDNISSGESTFMVEMNETASIMNNLSSRSLVLLDEIGRGTSTYDGLSIAWAVVEYLHENATGRPMTLFATHYHELNALAESLPRVRNFHVSIKEAGKKILFLRKLKPGGTAHSFGIHVAQLAGMPASIVSRAEALLGQLEAKSVEREETAVLPPTGSASRELQLNMFEPTDETALRIKELVADAQINKMTPIECMMLIVEAQKMLEAEEANL